MKHTLGTKVLFAGQYWPGANSMYIARSFERCGAIIRWVLDDQMLPNWSSLYGRALRRVIYPIATQEWNKKLLASYHAFEPDLVYITNAPYLDPKTVDIIQNNGTPIMCFYHDPHWRTRPLNRFRESISKFDLIVSTRRWHEADFKSAGAKAVQIVRFGYDPMAHRPVQVAPAIAAQYRADVTFIGMNEPRRARELTQLVSSDFPYSLRIWGHQWERLPGDSPLLQYWQKRFVFEQEIPVVYATSKVALHWINWEPDGPDEARRKGDEHNSRSFQIPACNGAIMMAQRTGEHQKFFEEDVEAVFFEDVAELREKLDYWLDPARDAARQQMAQRAYERCLKDDYTYDPVARQLLSFFGLG
jgi:spore maturation protein CgeB